MFQKISFFVKLKKWAKENPVEFWILAAILIVGAISRLYKINEYMTFLGDEGRDVIIVRRLLTEGHPPLIGPGTSIGNMYLGPLYYYLMAPALLIANFSPVGPAIQIAILGLVTIWMVWAIGREWFGKTAGLIAAGLYAISPTVIIYSRSSWNPNIMPFFALLSVYSIWRVWKYKEFTWLVTLGISFASVLQSHYLGLLLVPTLGVFWILTLIDIWKEKLIKKSFIRYSFFGLISFLLLMSPLLFFDMRHNWINFGAMEKFFSERQTTVSARPWSAVPKIPTLFVQINQSLIGAMNKITTSVVSIFILIGSIWTIYKSKNKKDWLKLYGQYYLVFLWMIFALVGFGIYKQNIYDHYFGFVFAVPYLLFGAFISKFIEINKYTKIIGFLLIICLVVINLAHSPLLSTPNNQLARARDVAQKISIEAGEDQFNLAVIAERNYQDGYKYFLLRDNKNVVEIDANNPQTISTNLYVVCEMLPEKCDPTHSARAEVANFGWSKIESTWEVDGVLVYRLSHTK